MPIARNTAAITDRYKSSSGFLKIYIHTFFRLGLTLFLKDHLILAASTDAGHPKTHITVQENQMKLPHHIAGASLALALAACSGAQNGATPMTLPNGGSGTGGAGGGITHYSVPAQQLTDAHKSTTALILVANEGAGTGGTISEFSESANGNVAPSLVITNHNTGPVAIAFSSKEGIGFANGGIFSGGQFGTETFSLAGDFLTGIEGFAKRTATNAVAFDSKGQLFVSAPSPEGRAIDVFAPGANNSHSGSKAKPKRTISDEGGLAIDSNNLLYVANSTTATIDIFPSGSATMEAQIGGSNTGLVAPGTVAVDASRNVYVFDNTTATISEFAAGVTGNVAPIRTIAGSKTGLTIGDGFNCAVAVSKNTGNIFVSNPNSNAVLVFAATASGDVAPIQTIAGGATQISNPLGIAVTE